MEERHEMMEANFVTPRYCHHSYIGQSEDDAVRTVQFSTGEEGRILNRGGRLVLQIGSRLVNRNSTGLTREQFLKQLEPSGEVSLSGLM